MKKILIIIGLIAIFFLLYFLQLNLFSWFTIAGIRPNTFIILSLFIGLFAGRWMRNKFGNSLWNNDRLICRKQSRNNRNIVRTCRICRRLSRQKFFKRQQTDNHSNDYRSYIFIRTTEIMLVWQSLKK